MDPMGYDSIRLFYTVHLYVGWFTNGHNGDSNTAETNVQLVLYQVVPTSYVTTMNPWNWTKPT